MMIFFHGLFVRGWPWTMAARSFFSKSFVSRQKAGNNQSADRWSVHYHCGRMFGKSLPTDARPEWVKHDSSRHSESNLPRRRFGQAIHHTEIWFHSYLWCQCWNIQGIGCETLDGKNRLLGQTGRHAPLTIPKAMVLSTPRKPARTCSSSTWNFCVPRGSNEDADFLDDSDKRKSKEQYWRSMCESLEVFNY